VPEVVQAEMVPPGVGRAGPAAAAGMLDPAMTSTGSESGADTEAELQAAIDGLYDAFAGHRRPGSFLGCACCWSGEPTGPGDGQVVVAAPGGDRPLRELTADELADLVTETPPGTNALAVLRHYLPRLFEIVAGDDGFGWPDLEIVVGRLAQRHALDGTVWTEWPAPEQGAIRRFLHALWSHRLATPDDDDPGSVAHLVDDTLCAIGRVDPDIDGYLDEWLRFATPAAALHLHRFLIENAAPLHRGRLLDAHWSTDVPPAPENQRRVMAWLRSPGTKDAVAAAADRARTPAEREALEESYLRWLD
jgi:hypothetical protein